MITEMQINRASDAIGVVDARTFDADSALTEALCAIRDGKNPAADISRALGRLRRAESALTAAWNKVAALDARATSDAIKAKKSRKAQKGRKGSQKVKK